MRRIKTVNLQPAESLPVSIFHECGLLLHAAGERFTPHNVALLRTCGIDYIYEVSNAAELARFKERTQYKAVRTSSLLAGSVLASPIFSTSKVLLLQANVQITEVIKDSLIRRGVGQVYIRKTKMELREDEALDYLRKMGKARRSAVEGDLGLVAIGQPKTQEATGPEIGVFETREDGMPRVREQAGNELAGQRGMERRRFKRLSTNLPVTVFMQRPYSSMWSDEGIHAVARDMSKGGICLMLSHDVTKEKRLRIKINYTRLKIMLDAVAEIVRFKQVGDHFEVGVRYVFVGAERTGGRESER